MRGFSRAKVTSNHQITKMWRHFFAWSSTHFFHNQGNVSQCHIIVLDGPNYMIEQINMVSNYIFLLCWHRSYLNMYNDWWSYETHLSVIVVWGLVDYCRNGLVCFGSFLIACDNRLMVTVAWHHVADVHHGMRGLDTTMYIDWDLVNSCRVIINH